MTKDEMDKTIAEALAVNHDCEKCALHRKVFTPKVPVTEEDKAVFERIATMMNNAEQLVKTPAPAEFSDKDREAFYIVAIKELGNTRALLSEWWTHCRHTYGCPIESKFDSYNGIFYTCNDDADVPDLKGEFIPKE